MNEEEFLQKIKGIKVNVPDEQFFLEYNAVVYNILKENQQLKEDISFCLKSIKQEMEMSIDSRTKQEMLSCYQILSKWSDK